MKIEALKILLDENFKFDKKFYFISGNEATLMEKINSIIIHKYQKKGNFDLLRIDTIDNLLDETSLFGNKKIYLGKNCKAINENSLNKIRVIDGVFIFVQENSQKVKNIKKLFTQDEDSYLIDCYELDRESKIKILNKNLEGSKVNLQKDLFWFLIEKLENKYIFFENNLRKVLELKKEDITLNNIKKVLTINEAGKDRFFFYLSKKNKDIVDIYKEKIMSASDVNELYYNCKFFCQLIIDCDTEDKYKTKIPIYLFKERNYLVDIYRKYNSKKKRLLLRLLSSTEAVLRKESGLSLIYGLRFLLNIKKITIS